MTKSSAPKGERIAKVIARAGICSRRQAEELITQGAVTVNGTKITSPALNVTPIDIITVNQKPLPQKEPTRMWKYYKPKGLLCSRTDPNGLPTIFDALKTVHPDLPYVISVGRLDFNSEGLLLLTNDGGVSRHLELPSTGWVRQYKVRVAGVPSQEKLDTLLNGITVEGIHYGKIEATFEKNLGTNSWVRVKLREGKNQEVRKVMAHLEHSVSRLIRLSYGPFHLGNMAENDVEEISEKTIREQIRV